MTNLFLDDDFKAMRDFLIYVLDVNDEVVECVCSINGYTLESLDDVCCWKYGMTCEDMKEDLKEEF